MTGRIFFTEPQANAGPGNRQQAGQVQDSGGEQQRCQKGVTGDLIAIFPFEGEARDKNHKPGESRQTSQAQGTAVRLDDFRPSSSRPPWSPLLPLLPFTSGFSPRNMSTVIVPRSVSTGSACTSPSSELVDSIGASTCPLNPSILPQPDDDSHTTFEKVATVVAVYKLARYWAERASTEPELYTIEQRDQKQAAYEAAGAMLLELNKGADKLSGASRQQLHILECELQSQGRSLIITPLLNPCALTLGSQMT
ncbi:hypothetical protein FA13DRAFT_1713877 [Coprinellus micaceus]|uniref:Uncharacterized protein n=1 Tax=Coprinellus micaceus TaxID=71717 RepID=A0A4Y7SUV0_COPMI|nr:hypothetical protein FA13DRAFT_1713877 [Coprinellus micaceus]